ncbi:MAG: AAA family ATPase [Chloroflexota bacterium]|nr:AAA family ATPase [Chloroflexota bacterium]MDE3192302.1 AAA family ATPase [Chloroflexota bacterium]
MSIALPVSSAPVPLRPDDLRWRCDPAALGFRSTDDVPPLEGVRGQQRAIDAIELGLDIDDPDHNVYVAGPAGTGRNTAVLDLLGRAAAARPAASDWCYLHSFDDPYRPIAVELPAGKGRELAADLDELIARCRTDIPKLFDGPEYERRKAEGLRKVSETRDALVEDLKRQANALGFGIEQTPMGILTVPLVDGKPIGPDAFALLSDERKMRIASASAELRDKVDGAVRTLRQLDREAHEAVHAVDREVALFAVGHVIDALRAKYEKQPAIVRHLDAIREDIVEHLDEFRQADDAEAQQIFAGPRAWTRYGANVLVASDASDGAPVVSEPNPTYANLVGRVDYRATLGVMQTDFRYIRPGALHRANGGFLVIQARDLLTSPYSYEGLKRALRDREVRIENPIDQLLGVPTATLKPAPVPLRARVVIIGDLLTYSLLRRFDEEFAKLFKIKAEFTPFMDRTPEGLRTYAAFIAKTVKERKLIAFSAAAVARIVEEGARLVSHRSRLAARFSQIEDIVVEAAVVAKRAGAATVRAEDVSAAVAARRHRSDLLEQELQRMIEEGTIRVETTAAVAGQVNGLSVFDLIDYAFARPSRITARTGPGLDGVVDIEREVELSGPTHSKGVLILAGYLLGKYGGSHPLALSARLTFEQSYSGVEGDSASSAELYAILSSLADAPIRQGIAVTGSVDQRGVVQAIGGVNEKIEGHFAVCKAAGLSGDQGVVVPRTNMRHLMLDDEVVAAVAAGRFHVWAIDDVDEGIELLTGVPAGVLQADGTYPAGTIHARVRARLEEYATRLAEHARAALRTDGSAH